MIKEKRSIHGLAEGGYFYGCQFVELTQEEENRLYQDMFALQAAEMYKQRNPRFRPQREKSPGFQMSQGIFICLGIWGRGDAAGLTASALSGGGWGKPVSGIGLHTKRPGIKPGLFRFLD